jgi:hypothetical protein
MCSRNDDTSQIDVENSEMRYESFGPIVNEDGSPSEFTKQMFRVESPLEERHRYYLRLEELRKAILHDFEDTKWYDEAYHGATLEAARQCVVEMQNLCKEINRVTETIADQIVSDMKHHHSGKYSESCVKCVLEH